MYNFDNAIDRRNTTSEKWNKDAIKSVSGNPDAEAFWVADMDLPTSNAIYKAINAAADFGVVGYPSDADTLVPLFASFVKERHDTVIDKSLTLYAQGMLHAVSLSIAIFSEQGDKILVPEPCYQPFKTITESLKRNYTKLPLAYDGERFSLDKAAYVKALDEGIKIVLFCSPHNPSGLVFSKEDLEFVLTEAKKRDILVISDEIHADLTHPGAKHYPICKVNETIKTKAITLFAPSKTFNVAGEHFAMAVFSDSTLYNKFKDAEDALRLSHPGFFALEIGKAAYGNSLDHNKALCSYLEENVSFIRSYLKENVPQIKLTNADASFVCFLDCSAIYEKVLKLKEKNPELFPNEAVLSHFFGQYANICMNDGTWFGEDYKTFVRFNYGTSRAEIKKALESIKACVKALN